MNEKNKYFVMRLIRAERNFHSLFKNTLLKIELQYQHFLDKLSKLEKDVQFFFINTLLIIKLKYQDILLKNSIKKNNTLNKFHLLLLAFKVLINKINNYKKQQYKLFFKNNTLALKNLKQIKNKRFKVLKQGLTKTYSLRERLALIGLGAFLSITFTTVADEKINPFASIVVTSGSSAADYIESDESVHPLQQHQIKSYTLVALIDSKKAKIAMIRAKNGQEYFIRMNDILGNSDGRVTGFNKNGIEVTQKDEVIALVVRNNGGK
jgi:hypothetical protein